MNCVLSALAACLRLTGFYVDASAGVFDVGLEPSTSTVVTYVDQGGRVYPWSAETIGRAVLNPYGRLAVGYSLTFMSADFYIEVAHVSSLAADSDRGLNAAMVGLRWHPFGRNQ